MRRIALVSLLFSAAVTENGSTMNETDCRQLLPAKTARRTYAVIMDCLLSTERSAKLGPGTFLLHRGLELPRGSSLQGSTSADSLLVSRLLIAAPTAITDFVLKVVSDSNVSHLVLDAGDFLTGKGCCTSVLAMGGNDSTVADVEVQNTSTGICVHFRQPTSRGNSVVRAHAHDCYYGVVFARGLNPDQRNIFAEGLVEQVACDGISFAGFGEATGNVIRESGFACGPPAMGAGAGFFCRGSAVGGIISRNEVYDTCGLAMDMDSCSNFRVSENVFRESGHDFGGAELHCRGMATVQLLDSQAFSFIDNSVSNTRVSNRQSQSLLGDVHDVFREVDSAPFSDLPAGADTLLNFAILQRRRPGALDSVHHEVVGNFFFSSCRGAEADNSNSSCLGLAYFAGRGTGLPQAKLPGYSWGERGEKQPSHYTSNRVNGSDVGSVRCGANRYAGSMPVCRKDAQQPCNEDDYLHPEKNFRNTPGCVDYASRIGGRLPEHRSSSLRNAMPVSSRSAASVNKIPKEREHGAKALPAFKEAWVLGAAGHLQRASPEPSDTASKAADTTYFHN
eukprot:TRINITY_DN77131_c0_g1_i1.p1 TRINITY_DN77131_c0_g1~~TRINITY_DN77131_c0_g1_i1.p1  ORF type:complete len:563 (-),score=99.95 TRINITY_DN77131_c0_g1_i1:49-1737(-)